MIGKNFSDRIIRGDRKAFEELYRMFYSRLLGFAKSYLKDEAVAENMVQDAFMQLWERCNTLRPDSNIQAWLLAVVKNSAINHINRMKRQIQAENAFANRATHELDLRITSLTACDPEYMFGDEVEQIIQKALDSLPEQCRKVITLSRFEDMSNREIAEKLGITVKGVEYHITNALKKLRKELKDYLIFLLVFGV